MVISDEDTLGTAGIDVRAIARIVHELLAGGRARLDDAHWLHSRAIDAGLQHREAGALEALRQRLTAQEPSLVRVLSELNWS